MISKEYIQEIIGKGFRLDGRKFDEYRKPVEIEYGVSAKSAEGSARVKIGDTEVVAGVKLEVGKPFPDKPDEGTIMVNVELTPLASSMFESGPPDIESIELARVVDRGLRESKAIDFKKLCVKEGEEVWLIFIDIYPINDNGNLFDACSLAALAALMDTKFPGYEDGMVKYDEKTKKQLELENLPLECTVWKIRNSYLIDPVIDEEYAADARLTVAIREDGKIAAMQKGGESSLTIENVEEMISIAESKTREIRGHLDGKAY